MRTTSCTGNVITIVGHEIELCFLLSGSRISKLLFIVCHICHLTGNIWSEMQSCLIWHNLCLNMVRSSLLQPLNIYFWKGVRHQPQQRNMTQTNKSGFTLMMHLCPSNKPRLQWGAWNRKRKEKRRNKKPNEMRRRWHTHGYRCTYQPKVALLHSNSNPPSKIISQP